MTCRPPDCEYPGEQPPAGLPSNRRVVDGGEHDKSVTFIFIFFCRRNRSGGDRLWCQDGASRRIVRTPRARIASSRLTYSRRTMEQRLWHRIAGLAAADRIDTSHFRLPPVVPWCELALVDPDQPLHWPAVSSPSERRCITGPRTEQAPRPPFPAKQDGVAETSCFSYLGLTKRSWVPDMGVRLGLPQASLASIRSRISRPTNPDRPELHSAATAVGKITTVTILISRLNRLWYHDYVPKDENQLSRLPSNNVWLYMYAIHVAH